MDPVPVAHPVAVMKPVKVLVHCPVAALQLIARNSGLGLPFHLFPDLRRLA